MKPYYEDKYVQIYHGDCREILPQLKGTGMITDPPYELGFMGKDWDKQGVSFQKETWQIVRESCLPGAMLLSFGGTRTFHRIACAIEDAGWELRDTIMWVYGSGFPKSLDISKAIDKQKGTHPDKSREFASYIRRRRKDLNIKLIEADDFVCDGTTNYSWFEGRPAGQRLPRLAEYERLKELLQLDTQFDDFIGEAEREVVGKTNRCVGKSQIESPYYGSAKIPEESNLLTIPATPEAQLWSGYGTALKPAYEPILVCMNPLDGTFANNALKHGVAGLNIDGCRVPYVNENPNIGGRLNAKMGGQGYGFKLEGRTDELTLENQRGRFPANIILDNSEEVLALFPQTKSGNLLPHHNKGGTSNIGTFKIRNRKDEFGTFGGDSGSAARFFYCAKASKSERNAGCGGLDARQMDESRKEGNPGGDNPRNRGVRRVQNNHPTVKPLALMKYLVKLISPPKDAVIIDPFMGSGTTLLACKELGIKCIGIDTDEYNCEIAAKRCCQEVMGLKID